MAKKKKNKLVMSIIPGIFFLTIFYIFSLSPSDDYIRNRVVKLVGPIGQCSGEQIQAPSGQNYIMSAKHCRDITIGDDVLVVTENKQRIMRKIIAVDPNSDLLLIEGLPNLKGLKIADESYRFEDIRVFSHGFGLDTYRTDGIVISDRETINTVQTITTAMVQPGSSGAPALDVSGYVMGVVSTENEGLSGLVRLKDVQNFLKKY